MLQDSTIKKLNLRLKVNDWHTWLLAERGVDYSGRIVTHFFVEDSLLGNKKHLASYSHGKWSFLHPGDKRVFFMYCKEYPKFIKNAVKKTQVSEDVQSEMSTRWTCFKRKCKFGFLKIKRLPT